MRELGVANPASFLRVLAPVACAAPDLVQAG